MKYPKLKAGEVPGTYAMESPLTEADVAAGRLGPFDREQLKRDVRDQLAARGVVD